MDGSFDLTLPAEPGSVAEARTKVGDAIEAHLPGDEAETIKLLVSELVTNAVKFGDGSHPVQLRAHWNSEVRVEVSDHNGGFTPGPRIGGLDEPGGFGLYLVGRLADRWGVESDDGTTVWFVLRRH
jgi:anti-sigma regulatory factor (Ser/Thr protein kinase)